MSLAPLISVIIPLYNKESSILHTINSVLKQDFEDFELILVDDGSTDQSIEKVSEISDDRLILYRKKNGGVSDARNYGMDRAKGDWIFFLDADDYIYPHCLSTFVSLKNNFCEAEFLTANFIKISCDNNTVEYCTRRNRGIVKRPYKSIWEKSIFPRTGSMLISKKLINRTGKFRVECTYYEDLEFILNLVQNSKIAYEPKVVMKYLMEYSDLSTRSRPFKTEYCNYLVLNSKNNFYRNIILVNLLLSAKKRRKKINDGVALRVINKKLYSMYHLVFISKFLNLIFFIKKIHRKLIKS